MDYLDDIFAALCAREHLWVCGEALPFCQRCTGLYVGAAMTAVLFTCFRPRPTNLMLWIYGLLLLLMVPFGYHLVPQNGTIRTLIGQLFAVGLVGYLSLLPCSYLGLWRGTNCRFPRAFAGGVLISVLLLQVAVHTGGALVGAVLTWLGVLGMFILFSLGLFTCVLIAVSLRRTARPKSAAPS